MVDDDTTRFWKKIGPRFWKEAASRAIDGYLEPAEHVILDLTESSEYTLDPAPGMTKARISPCVE